jgi:hypothetical protein
MTTREKTLEAYPIDWLLEENNPSVRYLTLTRILGRSETREEVKSARKQIMRTGVVPRILSKQTESSWNDPGRFYRDKYRSTSWQLIILAEHEADGRDPRIRSACEYLLRCSQDPESHGFAYAQRAGTDGGRHNAVIPCLTGNMVWSLVKLGWLNDPGVQRALEWITTYQRFDDGVAAKPTGWPYDRHEMCWGRHSCHLGVVKALKALAAVPKGLRKGDIEKTAAKASEYLLAHHVYKRSHDLSQVSKPGWLKLQFPLMYQTDILEVVDLLLECGCKDGRMEDAMRMISSKKNAKGQWNLESTFNGRFWVNIEKKGMPSKWITYRALKVLKRYHDW